MKPLRHKIFITGAAGFIASHLIRCLEADGHEVWGCDLSLSDNPRILRIDVADFVGLERMIQFVNPHIVYHLANYGNRYPDHFSYEMLWRTNLVGTEHILELQKRYGFDLIYTSSSEVYGTQAASEIYEHHEGDWWYNDYAASKWMSEKLIQRHLSENAHLKATILRLFGVYGEGQPQTKDNSVVSQFIRKIGNGEPIEIHDCERCFLYIDDCVDALIAAIGEPGTLVPYRDAINIGSQEKVTMRGLAELISQILKREYVESDKQKVLVGVKCKKPNISLAKERLGWSPKVGLYDGLQYSILRGSPIPSRRPYGVFVQIEKENIMPRRLSCAERCEDEVVIANDQIRR